MRLTLLMLILLTVVLNSCVSLKSPSKNLKTRKNKIELIVADIKTEELRLLPEPGWDPYFVMSEANSFNVVTSDEETVAVLDISFKHSDFITSNMFLVDPIFFKNMILYQNKEIALQNKLRLLEKEHINLFSDMEYMERVNDKLETENEIFKYSLGGLSGMSLLLLLVILL